MEKDVFKVREAMSSLATFHSRIQETLEFSEKVPGIILHLHPIMLNLIILNSVMYTRDGKEMLTLSI
jgi:hypothetical protein